MGTYGGAGGDAGQTRQRPLAPRTAVAIERGRAIAPGLFSSRSAPGTAILAEMRRQTLGNERQERRRLCRHRLLGCSRRRRLRRLHRDRWRGHGGTDDGVARPFASGVGVGPAAVAITAPETATAVRSDTSCRVAPMAIPTATAIAASKRREIQRPAPCRRGIGTVPASADVPGGDEISGAVCMSRPFRFSGAPANYYTPRTQNAQDGSPAARMRLAAVGPHPRIRALD